MKKLRIAFLILAMVAANSIGAVSLAAEKKAIQDVDTDEFTSDTQVTPKGSGDNHMALVWWIPNEFWESILSRDTTTSEADKKALLDSMSGISLLSLVQADVSAFGAFSFYSKEEIEQGMTISFADAGGQKHKLAPVQTIDPDLEVVLGIFKPILGAAMGSLGNNMHFYVLNDKSNKSKDASRLMDPYQNGQLDVQLTKKDKSSMNSRIEMPVNALFVPRKCPNGKDAHISWVYCPWSGKKLD